MSVERVLKALEATEPGAADIVLADAIWEEFYPQYIAARDLLIAKALDPVVVDAVRKSAIRSYVAAEQSGESGREIASAILDEYTQAVEVAKAQQAITRDGWVQYVNRDERGRFTRRSAASRSGVDVQRFMDEGRKLPKTLDTFRTRGNGKKFDYKQVAEQRGVEQKQATAMAQGYLEDWMQTNNLVSELKNRLPKDVVDDTVLILHFEDRNRPSQVVANWGDAKVDFEHDINSGRIAEYEIVPKSGVRDKERIAVISRTLDAAQKMDLLGASAVTAEQMNRIMQVLEPQDLEATRVTRLATLLSGAGAAANAVGMRTTGQALNQAAAAAGLGEEFRPLLTRAAYRYRGTEKPRPDRAFAEAVTLRGDGKLDDDLREILTNPNNASGFLGRDAAREAIKDYESRANNGKIERHTTLAPVVGQRVQMWANDPQRRPASIDQLRLGAQRDLVAQEFVRRQTRSFAQRTKEGTLEGGTIGTGVKSLRRLIQEIANGIGRDLPSEGVVIDANGKVVMQAVGVGGDHYQPFNIKGRKALDGGQYVRTRQLGGLTTDDLRMLLNSNARAGTVVSASGVFDIEFDPEFRNQERFNDRALGMVDTYERILDQLAASNIYARDLDPDTKQKLKVQARTRAERTSGDADAIYRELRDAARKQAMELQPDDVDKLRREAAEAGGSRSQVNDRFQQLLADKEKERVRTLGLNAEGYEVALKTLQSYYPYFIRDVSRRDLGTFMTASNDIGDTRLAHQLASAEGPVDSQYVRPGAVRSGNTRNAGLGLPEPKLLPYTGQGAPKAEQSAKPSSRSADASGGSPLPERPAAPAAERSEGPAPRPVSFWPEQTAKTPLADSLARSTDISPALARAAMTANANANRMYKTFPEMFSTDETDELAMLAATLDEDHMSQVEDYEQNAFKPSRTRPELADIRYMVDAVSKPDEVLPKLAGWLNGDPGRYQGLKTYLNSAPVPIVENLKIGLNSMVDVAMAASLAQQGWRSPGTPFDGKPMALPQLRDADSDAEVWAGIASLLEYSENGTHPFPRAEGDNELLATTADNGPDDELTNLNYKLAAVGAAHDIMMDARKVDEWFETAKTADGRSLADMNPTDKARNAMLDWGTLSNWYALRTGIPNGFNGLSDAERRAMLADALNMDEVDVQDAWDSAEMYYTAANASLKLEAARLAANGMAESTLPEALPKVLALLGGALKEGEMVDLKADQQKRAEMLRPVLEREVFKSLQSRPGVRLGSRAQADKVQQLVAKGMPPGAAAMRLRTTRS